MSDPALALVMLGVLVVTIMIGFPVAFTMMALGVAFGYYAYFQPGTDFFDNRVFYLLTQNTYRILSRLGYSVPGDQERFREQLLLEHPLSQMARQS